MKITFLLRYLLIFSTFLLLACGKDERKQTKLPEKISITGIESASAVVIKCLEDRLDFLKNKPLDIKTFIHKISTASVACNASSNDVLSYANEVFKIHGDIL